ncbi:MAG: DNA/RNA nuclease SfsA [Halobacteriovorax sp.]|nr:DNA/RNA nuclease SfsA [Halobacteriovorax sp.]|tara:strand:+ start:10047 stop:10751 length:705 start_codon:yes stop_codon:yes gene_type:complete
MKFPTKLIKGKIIKRYKRFLADIELEDGQVVVAHTANTGSMKTCWEPGWKVLCSYHDDPKRKLKYSLELTNNGKSWILVNTSMPNKLAYEAVEKELIGELKGYDHIKPEAKIGKSRIDLLLTKETGEKCYVEVKNVTLRGDDGGAQFPDGVTERGQKHLRELMEIKESGDRACMLYLVNRSDVDSFSPAEEIDPKYAQLLREAESAGVEILVYQTKITPSSVIVEKSLPYYLDK